MIPLGIYGEFESREPLSQDVSIKKFMLSQLSDTVGLLHPQTGLAVSARAVKSNVEGTLALVGPDGDVTTEFIAAGGEITGFCNGIMETGTVDIAASDIIIIL